MGNCIQSRVFAETQKQLIKVMGMDGKMLQYSPPLVVRDLLIESGYRQNFMVVHSENVGDGLSLDSQLVGGEFYYLIQSHIGADHDDSDEDGGKERLDDVGSSSAGAVKAENGIRLKIVVSKKQLKVLLSDGFLKERLVEELVGKHLPLFKGTKIISGKTCVAAREWRPCLDRIPEVN
ncbi:hypothetical protein SUGI_0638790 [Cryptomeria japonica]|uniref:uncharacterized protein LOC131052800 n=1 Tax=Cryptomeria japonica TaxID=3369 RepID=UPI0024147C89|nr:uncharacterized protein LOC131052800 [Cryptomeria japonica]GLJ31757.1 hypothetical protein SUGI_0638790 [Cryptomeria japonica]